MLKTFCLRSIVTAVVVASAALVPFAASADAAPVTASAWHPETVHYDLANEQCKLQRVPKGEAPAFGDGDICRYDLLDPKTKKRVGHAGFACGLIGPEEGVCDGTLVLPGGSLASAGDLVDGHQIAISGGTGRYMGALGQWSYGTTSPLITVELLLPQS